MRTRKIARRLEFVLDFSSFKHMEADYKLVEGKDLISIGMFPHSWMTHQNSLNCFIDIRRGQI